MQRCTRTFHEGVTPGVTPHCFPNIPPWGSNPQEHSINPGTGCTHKNILTSSGTGVGAAASTTDMPCVAALVVPPCVPVHDVCGVPCVCTSCGQFALIGDVMHVLLVPCTCLCVNTCCTGAGSGGWGPGVLIQRRLYPGGRDPWTSSCSLWVVHGKERLAVSANTRAASAWLESVLSEPTLVQ